MLLQMAKFCSFLWLSSISLCLWVGVCKSHLLYSCICWCTLRLLLYLNYYKQCCYEAQMVKNLPATWETQVQSLGWEDPLEKGKATHSSILVCIVHGVAKSQTWLSDFHSLTHSLTHEHQCMYLFKLVLLFLSDIGPGWNCWIMWQFLFFVWNLPTVLYRGCINLHSH